MWLYLPYPENMISLFYCYAIKQRGKNKTPAADRNKQETGVKIPGQITVRSVFSYI